MTKQEIKHDTAKVEWRLRTKIFVVLGIAGGFFLGMYFNSFLHDVTCHDKFFFIGKEVACNEKVIDKRGYVVLRTTLQEYLEAETERGRLSQVSVYFRDLNAGPAFGINESATFTSASLLKLPIAIAVYKLAEDLKDEGDILDVEIRSTSNGVARNQFFAPKDPITSGTLYTVSDLIERLLIDSDNTATEMLVDFLHDRTGDNSIIVATMKDLGLILPKSFTDQDISVRSYASIYRLLYNSSFLTPAYSEKLLEVLSRTGFEEGLRNGVPTNIKISHKFGEREDRGVKQLHDCGVVYFPGNPYLLCILTSGSDYTELSTIIRTISEMFYAEIDSRRL